MSGLPGVALLVTTVCDRRCPHCCYGLSRSPEPLGAPEHHPWAWFEAAAAHLRGAVGTLYVTGGEPTLHPLFPRIAQEFRALFQPRALALATNGAQLVAHGALVPCFDIVKLTDFADGAAPAAKAWLRANHPRRLRVETAAHRPLRGLGAGARPCGRRSILAVTPDRVWPCCVAPGLPGARSVPLAVGWQAAAARVAPPCGGCPFGVPGGDARRAGGPA